MEIIQKIERLKAENALLLKLLHSGEHVQMVSEPETTQISFVDFYKMWLAHKKAQVQGSTFFEYSRIFNNYIN